MTCYSTNVIYSLLHTILQLLTLTVSITTLTNDYGIPLQSLNEEVRKLASDSPIPNATQTALWQRNWEVIKILWLGDYCRGHYQRWVAKGGTLGGGVYHCPPTLVPWVVIAPTSILPIVADPKFISLGPRGGIVSERAGTLRGAGEWHSGSWDWRKKK